MNTRDLNLDFVKGILVIVMVVYHVMNYFSMAGPEHYGYLRFINGAFVFASGYVVAIFYGERHRLAKFQVYKRLLGRGIKLLAIFTLLNLLISVIGVTSYKNVDFSMPNYVTNLAAIYGPGDGNLMAFQILVPISYVLLISPLYLAFQKWRIALIAFTMILALLWTFLGLQAPNVFFVLVGLVGLSLGMIVGTNDIYPIRSWLVICIGLGVSTFVMNRLSGNVLTYSLGISIVLMLIYNSAGLINLRGSMSKIVVQMGQYSLVCYIAQIVFLYGLYRGLPKQKWPLGFELVLIFACTTAFLALMCMSLTHLRHRYELADRTYKLIFA
jgi:uncharacterized membrane protein